MKISNQVGSLFNGIMEKSPDSPDINKGCTLLLYSDRHAYFINSISKDGKRVEIERAKSIRIDNNGMGDSQDYRYERYPEGQVLKHTLVFRYNNWYNEYTDYLKNKAYNKIKIYWGGMQEYHDFTF